MKNRIIKAIAAALLTAALVLPLAQAKLSRADSVDATAFVEQVKQNLASVTDVNKYGAIHVKGALLNADHETALKEEAQNYALQNPKNKPRAALFDVDGDGQRGLFLKYGKGKNKTLRIARLDTGTLEIKYLATVSGFRELRTPGKYQVAVKQQQKKTTTYTVYQWKKGKWKKVVSYSKTKKKCKKNKKKISVAAFKSYVKKFKKYKKIALKKIPAASTPGTALTNTEFFFEPGRSVSCCGTGGQLTTHVFIQDAVTANTQNYNYAFQYARSRFSAKNYELVRLVFGPPVTGNDNKRNTFQELDFMAAHRETFDILYGNPYLCEVLNLYEIPEFRYSALNISDLKIYKDSKTALGSTRSWEFRQNDDDIRITLYTDGALAGRAQSVQAYQHGSGFLKSTWTYTYGDEAKKNIAAKTWYTESQLAHVRGGINDIIGVDENDVTKVRILNVNLFSAFIKNYTDKITTASDVKFRLYTSSGAFFYNNDPNQVLNSITKHVYSDQRSIAGYLNPPVGGSDYGDGAFPGGISWKWE